MAVISVPMILYAVNDDAQTLQQNVFFKKIYLYSKRFEENNFQSFFLRDPSQFYFFFK